LYEKNLTSINYALIEYYMYLFSVTRNNMLYTRFQNLKSYLNVSYTIDISPENVPDIVKKINSQPICLQSWKYFQSIVSHATTITEQIISQNYAAEQAGNYEVIYNNVEKYNLKLRGFTEMKTEYLSKTLSIISSMLSKGLLRTYSDTIASVTGNVSKNNAAGITNVQRMMPSTMKQPIAVNVGGKKISKFSRKTRKNIKKMNKNKTRSNMKKIYKKRTAKKY